MLNRFLHSNFGVTAQDISVKDALGALGLSVGGCLFAVIFFAM